MLKQTMLGWWCAYEWFGMVPVDQRRVLGDRFGRVGRVRRRVPLTSFAAIAFAIGLLAVERIAPTALTDVRTALVMTIAPGVGAVRQALARPAAQEGPLSPAAQNGVGHAALLAARVAELERDNLELRRLAHFTDAQTRVVSGRIVSRTDGLVSQSLLISAGVAEGVAVERPVVANGALVGRTTRVYRGYASVMLLSDRASRVPVEIGAGRIRAVLAGDGSPSPRLDFVAPNSAVVAGDRVVTSGIGGVYPRGLAVGLVASDGEALRVELSPAGQDSVVAGVLDLDVDAVTRIPQQAPHVRQSLGRAIGLPTLGPDFGDRIK